MGNSWKKTGAAAVALAALLAGCGGGASKPADQAAPAQQGQQAQQTEKQPKKGGTLTIAMAAGPRNIDPRLQWDSNSQIAESNIVDRLFTVAPDFSYRPLLAESWTHSDDAKTYTFKLRQGVKFQDGTDLTAAVIKQNILWAADPKHKSPQVSMWDNLDSVDAPDPLTVVIKLKKPESPDTFLAKRLDSPWPLSGKQVTDNGDNAVTNPIAAGPFKFVSYTGDNQLVMDRNDAYWGGAPFLDKVIFRVIPDAATRRVEIERGSVDVLMDVQPKDVQEYKDKGLTILRGPANTSDMISINLAHAPLDDLNVRKALAYAIDRDALIKKVFYGYVTKATTYMHPQNVNAAKDIAGYSYDVKKAQDLLDQAGWKAGADGIRTKDGKRLDLTIASRNDDTWNLMSQVLVEQLKAIGIAATINTTDTSAFYNAVRAGTYDICYWSLNASGWTGLDHPNLRSTDWGNIAHMDKSSQAVQTVQKTVDGIIDGFESSLDSKDRVKYAHDLQQIVNDQVITVPLWFEDRLIVTQPYVHGIEAPMVVRTVRLEKAWLDK